MSSENRRSILSLLIVFAVALIALGWHLNTAGIAAPFSDPVAKIRAQDEAPYVDSAIRMANQGDWLTPRVMGRYFLQKPPLLFWMAGVSLKLFGWSLTAVRLPSLLLGALAVAAIFAWCRSAGGLSAGIVAAGLLAASPFWQIFSRLCYTDIPSIAFAVLAMTAVALDTKFERRSTPYVFGAAVALSMLAKSVAGVLPFAALALWWLLVPAPARPRLARLALAALACAVVLIPWHLYQALVHPQWFWADYVQLQLLGVGLRQSATSIFARPTWFYLERLAQMDPVALVAVLAAIPGSVLALRRRDDAGVLLAICWTVVTLGALFAFQAKNLPYMVFLMPPLCVLAALYGPAVLRRNPAVAAVIVIALCGARSLAPQAPPLAGAAAMRDYYNLRRDAELMSCATDDEFYSATIPLPRVRYCFVDAAGDIARSAPHYATLGIILPAAEFMNLTAVTPQYRERLRNWGLDSAEPIATTVTLPEPATIARIIAARPDLDFYLPAEWEPYAGATHALVRYSSTRIFLLSRTAGTRRSAVPALPREW